MEESQWKTIKRYKDRVTILPADQVPHTKTDMELWLQEQLLQPSMQRFPIYVSVDMDVLEPVRGLSESGDEIMERNRCLRVWRLVFLTVSREESPRDN